jgi:hypothetical protein
LESNAEFAAKGMNEEKQEGRKAWATSRPELFAQVGRVFLSSTAEDPKDPKDPKDEED